MMLRWRAWWLVWHILLRLRQGRYLVVPAQQDLDDLDNALTGCGVEWLVEIHGDDPLVVVRYIPRWPRILDGVVVEVMLGKQRSDVWLPLLPRLLLRAGVRRWLVEKALQ